MIKFNTLNYWMDQNKVSFLIGENKDDIVSIDLVKSDSTALGLSGSWCKRIYKWKSNKF